MHPRPPHRINDHHDRALAVSIAAEFQADDSPDPVRDLDDEAAVILAHKLVRVTRLAGWSPADA